MDLIETRTAYISENKFGIIYMKIKDNISADLEDVADNVLVIRNLSQGKQKLKLYDARTNWEITKEAEMFLKKDDSPSKTIARAVIVKTDIEKVVVSFFNQFKKATIPLNYFTSEDEAIIWLLSIEKLRKKNDELNVSK